MYGRWKSHFKIETWLKNCHGCAVDDERCSNDGHSNWSCGKMWLWWWQNVTESCNQILLDLNSFNSFTLRCHAHSTSHQKEASIDIYDVQNSKLSGLVHAQVRINCHYYSTKLWSITPRPDSKPISQLPGTHSTTHISSSQSSTITCSPTPSLLN